MDHRATIISMVSFTSTLLKFARLAEKTGWTYILIPGEIAEQIKPGHRRSFRVKGKIDKFAIRGVALLPMGDGSFCMPVNAAMRKGVGKRQGAIVSVKLSEDTTAFQFNPDFIECLNDDPDALEFFNTLAPSHQRYFSKWIDDAKTLPTRTKRIAQAMDGLAKKMDFGQMIRFNKKKIDI